MSEAASAPKATQAPSYAAPKDSLMLAAAPLDNRTGAVAQRRMQEAIASSPPQVAQRQAVVAINSSPRQVAQRQTAMQLEARPNRTGLPDNIKAGVENLSGHSLDDVQVHYNSAKPAQLQAHAYAQGAEIHLAPGQEKHLPHEAWHVAQQKQGRVRATTQLKGVGVNDDSGLEREADVMGGRAVQFSGEPMAPLALATLKTRAVQLFSAPPAAPPAAGVRGGTTTGGVPTESHITTVDNAPNDLVGTAPGAIIHGWQHILTVGASGPWVRFHLINQQVGGRGDQANLVPTSHATNVMGVWRSYENRIKALAAAQTSMHATVDVTYPNPIGGATPGTLPAVSHYYPDSIAAQVHYWDGNTNTYVLDGNQPSFVPFPLQPPALAGHTDLAQQTWQWLKTTLMGGRLNDEQAQIFWEAIQDGTVNDLRDDSNEQTPESQLMDALDEVGTVNCMIGAYSEGRKRKKNNMIPGSKLPPTSRIQVLNGAYILP